MQLEHSFTVPVGIDDAWAVLLDIERIAPCMPGAAIASIDGDDFTGTVKVKLGPIGMTYKGKASFVEKDAIAHRAVIDARGRDARGNGTANAKVSATLTGQGTCTKVDVLTDLDITGKPAQFGRGVMVDVGNKLIGQFADSLAAQLTGDPSDAAADTNAAASTTLDTTAGPSADDAMTALTTADPTAATATQTPAAPATARRVPAPAPRAVEPINLMESAGPAVAKRLAPPLLAIALLAGLVAVWRRRSR
jgi:carbon monoxide dehydrogenase subunit G